MFYGQVQGPLCKAGRLGAYGTPLPIEEGKDLCKTIPFPTDQILCRYPHITEGQFGRIRGTNAQFVPQFVGLNAFCVCFDNDTTELSV